MSADLELNGRRALVTGGTQGWEKRWSRGFGKWVRGFSRLLETHRTHRTLPICLSRRMWLLPKGARS